MPTLQRLNTSKVFPNLFLSLLRLSGVFPLNSSFEVSCVYAIYSLLLVLVITGIQLSSPYVAQVFENCCKLENPSPPILSILNKSSLLTKFIRACLPIIMASAPSVSILNSLWKYSYYFPNYIKGLVVSDAILKKDKLFDIRQRKFSFIYTSISLLIDISIKASTLTSLILSGTVEGLMFSWIVVLFTIDFVGFSAEVQFIVMVNALKIRFEEVNHRLVDLFSTHSLKIEYKIKHFANKWRSEQALSKILMKRENAPTLNKTAKFINTITLSPLHVRPVGHDIFMKEFPTSLSYEAGFQNSNKNNSKFLESKDFSTTIYLLRMSHRSLSTAFYSLNSMFEYMLLISIFTRFLMILGNSYFAIFGFDKVFILSHRWDVSFWLFKCLFRFVSQLVMSDLLSETVSTQNELLIY